MQGAFLLPRGRAGLLYPVTECVPNSFTPEITGLQGAAPTLTPPTTTHPQEFLFCSSFSAAGTRILTDDLFESMKLQDAAGGTELRFRAGGRVPVCELWRSSDVWTPALSVLTRGSAVNPL